MTRLHKFLAQVAAGAAVLAAANAQSQILYQDVSDWVANFNNGNGEIGNEIALPGNFGSYMITKFIFQFDFSGTTPPLHLQNSWSNSLQLSWAATSTNILLLSTTDLTPPVAWSLDTNQPLGSNGLFYVTITPTNTGQFFRLFPVPNGTEMADMRFYRNDGNPVSPSSNTAPGTIIYDSGQFSIGGFTEGSKAIFREEDLFGGVDVPQNFTWTVKFSGLTPNENAGLALCESTSVGTNFSAVWLESFEGWEFLMSSGGTPAPNFGAVAYGTPLPQLQSASQDGMLLLSWPTNFIGFTVETTTNLLNPTNWVPVTNVVVINGQNVLSNTASGDSAFFRLVNNSLPASILPPN